MGGEGQCRVLVRLDMAYFSFFVFTAFYTPIDFFQLRGMTNTPRGASPDRLGAGAVMEFLAIPAKRVECL